ncbi:PD-(D/E)XK nuclease family transposase [Moorella naiadis (nom. illeg.)]|uniref:PD-(D/E)XK nuclease family transposase n=1 Tax=Moorella naiadis (nom. illeg.) TaxID=3093670 RepID=UPI003D9C85C2
MEQRQHNIRETSKSGLATVKGINRTNDYAFKRILGSEEGKEALLGFLNAVLNPPSGREFTYVELPDRELDPASLLERGARLENPAIRKALTIEEAFKRNEQERRLYELREKALRDEISMMEGAMAEGKAEGKAEMAQEAICQYLEARFGKASQGLQKKVKEYNSLEVLTKIMNKIYTAGSLEDARAIIEA